MQQLQHPAGMARRAFVMIIGMVIVVQGQRIQRPRQVQLENSIELQGTASTPVVRPEQMVVVPSPVVPPNCLTFTDAALRSTRGVLCASQHVSHNVTKIICNEWKPECRTTVTEHRLIDPAAPGAEPDAYAKTATAACELLGYTTFGTGSMHTIGSAKETCWNGQAWAEDNWWTTLVCCK